MSRMKVRPDVVSRNDCEPLKPTDEPFKVALMPLPTIFHETTVVPPPAGNSWGLAEIDADSTKPEITAILAWPTVCPSTDIV